LFITTVESASLTFIFWRFLRVKSKRLSPEYAERRSVLPLQQESKRERERERGREEGKERKIEGESKKGGEREI